MDFGVLLKEGETVRYVVRTGRGVSLLIGSNKEGKSLQGKEKERILKKKHLKERSILP
jgi:hypothetical protein